MKKKVHTCWVRVDLDLLRSAFTVGIGHTSEQWQAFWTILRTAGAVKSYKKKKTVTPHAK